MRRNRRKLPGVKVIDLFSGIGGLTHGFVLEGFDVVAGIDIDGDCKHGFEKNNGSKFVEKNISKVTPTELRRLYGDARVKVLIGCAPCQPYSTLNRDRSMYTATDTRWAPLRKFLDLIVAVKPHIVSMENVRELADGKKYPIFRKFVRTLKANGYDVAYKVVDASRYGVPQTRRRLVLLASRFGEIALPPETHDEDDLPTVRQWIADLPRISDGKVHATDALHRSSRLSATNKKRIAATAKDGGGPKDWRRNLLPACYKLDANNTYKSSVYGRMRWDSPGPTMTTHCVTLGTGRYGHPTQRRAISLREAARLQTFPDYYEFTRPEDVSMRKVARFIGNAVPVKLGQAIAASVRSHLKAVKRTTRTR